MRVVSETPMVEFKLTIYSWNNKYLLKYERGMYEQTYKVSEFDVSGDKDIMTIANDPDFVKEVLDKFKNMNSHLNEALNRI